jgi:hypothetical protein
MRGDGSRDEYVLARAAFLVAFVVMVVVLMAS